MIGKRTAVKYLYNRIPLTLSLEVFRRLVFGLGHVGVYMIASGQLTNGAVMDLNPSVVT